MAEGSFAHGMRIEISLEAKSLIANRGADAYRVALMRAEEASSDEIARNWRQVAETIARSSVRGERTLLAVSH